MMDKVIRPSEGDWSTVVDPSAEIARWEKDTGWTLPDDYRSFMARYNGGRIYPLIFNCAIEDEYAARGEPETFLDPFYNWERVERLWNGESFDGRIPPNMLVIGSNPGGIQILMSLAPATHGQIFLWLHSQSHWGADNNDTVWPQATGFRAFVDSLYDDDEESGYDYWYRPGKKGMERKVEF